jgi:hypothetical protein
MAVDPAEAQRDVEGFGMRYGCPARALLGDLQPDTRPQLVMVGQPGLPNGLHLRSG